MRGKPRKLLQEPMKSPSPDVANRSIIRNTQSPINDVKAYIRMRQNEKSPHNKSLANSFHQIGKGETFHHQKEKEEIVKLRKYIEELEGKIRFLERIKVSHDQLNQINQRLSQQVADLKQQLARKQRATSASNSPISGQTPSPQRVVVPSPKSTVNFGTQQVTSENQGVKTFPNIPQEYPRPRIQSSQIVPHQTAAQSGQNQHILRQFNQRLMKMSEQNKRLCKKLKQVKDKKDLMEIENMKLRDQKIYQEFARKSQEYKQSSSDKNNQSISQLKCYFDSEIKQILTHYQQHAEKKISQLSQKLKKTEQKISKLGSRMENARSSYSPFEGKGHISAETKSQWLQHETSQRNLQGNLGCIGQRVEMVESKYTNSPNQVKAFTIDSSPVRVLQEERYRMQQQNIKLKTRIAQLQNQLKHTLLNSSELQKKLKKQYESHKKIQSKAVQFQRCLNEMQNSLNFKNQQLKQLQKRLQIDKKCRQDEIKDYSTMVKQEKQKSETYLQQIQQLQDRVNYYEKCLEQQQNMQHQKFESLDAELHEIKDKYKKLLDEQNKVDLEKYLEQVLEIRYSITGEDVQNCLTQIDETWKGYDQLEKQLFKIKEAYQIVIKNHKKKLLEQQQRIAGLQAEVGNLTQNINQMQVERNKLYKAIQNYSRPQSLSLTQQELQKRITYHQSTKGRSPCQIRDYINHTVEKIETLQQEIEMTLKSNQKPRVTESFIQNSRYFTPASDPMTLQKSDFQRQTRPYSTIVQQPSRFSPTTSQHRGTIEDIRKNSQPSLLYDQEEEK